MKQLTRFALAACLSVAVYGYSGGQTVKPSADAMATVNSIQNPVDYSTGTVSTQIPLYSVQSGSVQVPVSLIYSSTGRKVYEQCSSVGLGWRLSAGGKVTRMVRGQADTPGANGWATTDLNYVARTFYSGAPAKTPYYNRANLEPDLFYFEIPGKSGMFVLDGSGIGRPIPHQNITIQFVAGETAPGALQRSHFVIKDENGTVYTFGTGNLSRETTSVAIKNMFDGPADGDKSESESAEAYFSTWHLDRIDGYAGGRVSFDYQSGSSVTNENLNYTYSTQLKLNSYTEIGVNESRTTTTVTPMLPRSITWEGGELVFVKTSGQNRLDRINYVTSENIKTTKFTYAYHIAGYSPDKQNPFSLLTSIDETNFSSVTIGSNVARFEYYPLPALTANSKMDFDSWGYYNATGNGNTTYRPSGGNFYSGANRSPNLTTTLGNMLKKVTYPTQGTVEYVYELNKIHSPGDLTIGGLRIKEIRRKPDSATEMITRYEYMLPGGVYSSGVARELPKHRHSHDWGVHGTLFTTTSHPMNDMFELTGQHVIYSHVTEIQPNGSKVTYEFSTSQDQNYADVDPEVYSCNTSYVATRIYPTYGPTSEYGPPYPKTSRFWRRGLLKSVTGYDTNGNVIKSEAYEYTFGSPVNTVKSYFPYRRGDKTYYSTYFSLSNWISEPVYMSKVTTNATAYNPRSETTFTYNTQYMMPTEVVTTDAEGNVTKNVTKYNFDFQVSPLSNLTSQKIVRPVEQTTYRKPVGSSNFIVTGSQLTEYAFFTVGTTSAVLPARTYSLLINRGMTFTPAYVASSALKKDANYKHLSTVESYDPLGRPRVTTTPTGDMSTTLYGYNNTLPVATVSNANYAEMSYRRNAGAFRFDSYQNSGTTRTEAFNIQYEQSVYVQVRHTGYLYDQIQNGGQLNYTLEVRNASTNMIVQSCRGVNEQTTSSFTLPAGDYYITFYLDYTSDVDGVFFYVNMEKTIPVYNRRNQIFHTSFEDVAGAVTSAHAKTGTKVYNGAYPIDMNNFAAGTYVLTYWKINASTGAKTKVTENVTVPSATGELGTGVIKTIPYTAGFHIDEVRVIPADARIITYTYRPGVGMLSETDHNGVSTHYQYDVRGRLYRVLNNDKQALKQYEYKVLGDN